MGKKAPTVLFKRGKLPKAKPRTAKGRAASTTLRKRMAVLPTLVKRLTTKKPGLIAAILEFRKAGFDVVEKKDVIEVCLEGELFKRTRAFPKKLFGR